MGRIGVRGQVKSEKVYTENSIQDILIKNFLSKPKYTIPELYCYLWESDLLIISNSMLAYEFEIKISRADFKNDFKHKETKHKILEYCKKSFSKNLINEETKPVGPNYFYYVVPENLITADEVPEYAGLIYIVDYFPFYLIVKTAPKLHNNKFVPEHFNLVDKFYYNYINYRTKFQNEEKDRVISELRQEIRDLKKLHEIELKEAKEENSGMIELLKTEYKVATGFDITEVL